MTFLFDYKSVNNIVMVCLSVILEVPYYAELHNRLESNFTKIESIFIFFINFYFVYTKWVKRFSRFRIVEKWRCSNVSLINGSLHDWTWFERFERSPAVYCDLVLHLWIDRASPFIFRGTNCSRIEDITTPIDLILHFNFCQLFKLLHCCEW